MEFLQNYTKENGKKGKRFCEESEADYVVLPINDYNGSVLIPEEEYNGLQKAVRIVRNRAKQQIDKSKADKNGYTLLRADKRQYSYKYESPAWLVTRSTPYSIKMTLDEVTFMLNRDLREFYGFLDLPLIETTDYNYKTVLKQWNIKDFFSIMGCHNPKEDRSKIGSEEVLQKLDFLDSCDWKLAFEISRIAKNAATGCYEVSYWATEPI